jgi:4a-hydroxytetrahydrobiopterin dehydratase
MERLTDDEKAHAAATLPDWELRDDTLIRTFVLKDFAAAMEFTNAVAVLAEAARHHPDIEIRWNKVKLTLTSHDAGGLTQRDLDLANGVESLPSQPERQGAG